VASRTVSIFLARDRTSRDYVVIELKRDQGDDEVIGQVSRYMGWIRQRRADHEGVGVRASIVAHRCHGPATLGGAAASEHQPLHVPVLRGTAPVVATAKADKSKAPC